MLSEQWSVKGGIRRGETMSAQKIETPRSSVVPGEHEHVIDRPGLPERIKNRVRGLGPRDPWLRRLWLVGLGLLGVQLLAMVIWSTILWSHFSLTQDYSMYHQAWWLISHGDLDPKNYFFVVGHPFWQNNFELLMWPLAILGVIFPHGPVLLILQDTCLFGAEVVAWAWMAEATSSIRSHCAQRLLCATGLVLLLGNPWAWTAISFDFHMELIGIFFLMLAGWDLYHGRRRGWIWIVPAVMCGDMSAAWVAGLGLGLMLVQRKQWRRGAGVLAMGAAYLGISAFLHGDVGGGPYSLYGYLAGAHFVKEKSLGNLVVGIVSHPINVIKALWAHRWDTWANLAPGGLIGLLSPITLGVGLVDLGIVDLSSGNSFSQPLFQNVDLYVLVPLGTIIVLVWLWKRAPRLVIGAGVLLAANAIIWSVIFMPRIPGNWLLVPSSSASVLASVDKEIPPSAEVLASQGVIGRFTDRRLVYPIRAPRQVIPVGTRDTWWIITPTLGIELDTVTAQDALIAKLAGSWNARLVAHGDGVWVFNWMLPQGITSVRVPGNPVGLPGWLLAGTAARRHMNGPVSTWAAQGTGERGYVMDKDYFRLRPGRYNAQVTLSSSVPVQLQVWNDTGNILLSQRSLLPTNGDRTVTMKVDATKAYPHKLFSGWGPFQVGIVPPPAGQVLEIRVWSSGGGIVKVTWLQISRARKSNVA